MIRLLELRTEKDLSQRDMAKIFNISQGTYNNWENNNTQPSIDQLISLANFFGVTVDYLIGNSNEFDIANENYGTSEYKNLLKLFASASPKLQNAVLIILEESNNN